MAASHSGTSGLPSRIGCGVDSQTWRSTATGLPATIEGAVLSGHACARLVSEASGARANLPG